MMREYYGKQLEKLKEDLIKFSEFINLAIKSAATALFEKNVELAETTIGYEPQINDYKKDIESQCLKILLMQQPVASDLRFVSSAHKMVTDVYKIGTFAADISEITVLMASDSYENNLGIIKKMYMETSAMVMKSIEAFATLNAGLAKEVIAQDDVVDHLFLEEKDDVVKIITENPADGNKATDLLMIGKYFERIGDHAVTIAEYVLK